ncbi:MAG: M23 family metallopeptidase [Mycolicibacterium sp.]|nr:M23 family metallopeptidase [Mycolicibacterium sp.]
MRILTMLIVAVLAATATATAEAGRLQWPLRPSAMVTRGFDAPSPNWTRGHRGVDLAGSTGQTVLASAGGTVVFAGELAGRPLVSVQHPGGLRTSYEPVRPAVRAGQRVQAGAALGVLLDGHAGCPVRACLHWGAMWGPASRAAYVDPLGLLASTPIVLKPVDGPDRAPHAAARP